MQPRSGWSLLTQSNGDDPGAPERAIESDRVILQGLLSPSEASAANASGAKARGNMLIGPADLWTPYASGGGIFGERRHALDLIAADRHPAANAGHGVNVVILDYGISDAWLRRHRQTTSGSLEGVFGGWSRYGRERGSGREWFSPGRLKAGTSEHGHMLARNILSIAPAARIWDVPLLPDTALGPPGLAMAEAIFYYIRRDIQAGRQIAVRDPARNDPGTLPKGPWVLVNAWGALNPERYDAFFDTRYSDNPDHCFVEDMPKFFGDAIHADMVFAAGNCGTPGAQPLCGEDSVGAGRSIHGVNAHPSVLTVGAVRVDGVPIGSSAQGPGMLSRNWPRDRLAGPPVPGRDDPRAKPDICAPSHFRETEDGRMFNTGTSAACGVAAGILALLRGIEVQQGLWDDDPQKKPATPEQMRAALRQTASRPAGPNWDRQLGWGIANLAGAKAALNLG